MKQGSTVSYLYGDRLGSTNVTTNSSGGLTARQTYYAYGTVRTTSGTLPTDYTFTGQKLDASSSLMYYGSRYYDAAIGRFAQPDSIVPNPYNPQSLNRYSYVLNNPLRYTDPTGHCDQDTQGITDDECWLEYYQVVNKLGFDPSGLDEWETSDLRDLNGWSSAGVRFTSDTVAGEGTGSAWTGDNLRAVMNGLGRVRSALGNGVGAALGLDRGSLTFNSWAAGWSGGTGGNYDAPINRVNLYLWGGGHDQSILEGTIQATIHEMGHVVDWFAGPIDSQWGWSATTTAWLDAGRWQRSVCDSCQQVVGWKGPGVPGVSAYANMNPGEDFAESFRFHVNGSALIPRARRDALTSALSQFR